jgi:hypothetical protein
MNDENFITKRKGTSMRVGFGRVPKIDGNKNQQNDRGLIYYDVNKLL